MHASFWFDENDGGWAATMASEGFAIVDGRAPASGGDWGGGVVDGYELLDRDTLGMMRRLVRSLVCVVDDVAPASEVDLIVNAGAEMAAGADDGVLAGLKYALVDPSFARIPDVVQETVSQVLVAMGRTDAAGATLRVVQALSKARFQGPVPTLTVILGSTSPFLRDVERALQRFPGSSQLLVDVAGMADLYAEADLVIVAGGVSVLECLAGGRPNIVIKTAENQAGNIAQALMSGGSMNGGNIAAWDEGAFIETLTSLCESHAERVVLAAQARRAVDGAGAERVASALAAL